MRLRDRLFRTPRWRPPVLSRRRLRLVANSPLHHSVCLLQDQAALLPCHHVRLPKTNHTTQSLYNKQNTNTAQPPEPEASPSHLPSHQHPAHHPQAQQASHPSPTCQTSLSVPSLPRANSPLHQAVCLSHRPTSRALRRDSRLSPVRRVQVPRLVQVLDPGSLVRLGLVALDLRDLRRVRLLVWRRGWERRLGWGRSGSGDMIRIAHAFELAKPKLMARHAMDYSLSHSPCFWRIEEFYSIRFLSCNYVLSLCESMSMYEKLRTHFDPEE
ncbi:uncharacterized protein BDV17DRAFT_174659 [Aspergillus undulatus]|uniref:uncharacterized protein n=1 Tax=Aspergillus undulatus TaxID=1810928 RepID=UPI003CCDCD30